MAGTQGSGTGTGIVGGTDMAGLAMARPEAARADARPVVLRFGGVDGRAGLPLAPESLCLLKEGLRKRLRLRPEAVEAIEAVSESRLALGTRRVEGSKPSV